MSMAKLLFTLCISVVSASTAIDFRICQQSSTCFDESFDLRFYSASYNTVAARGLCQACVYFSYTISCYYKNTLLYSRPIPLGKKVVNETFYGLVPYYTYTFSVKSEEYRIENNYSFNFDLPVYSDIEIKRRSDLLEIRPVLQQNCSFQQKRFCNSLNVVLSKLQDFQLDFYMINGNRIVYSSHNSSNTTAIVNLKIHEDRLIPGLTILQATVDVQSFGIWRALGVVSRILPKRYKEIILAYRPIENCTVSANDTSGLIFNWQKPKGQYTGYSIECVSFPFKDVLCTKAHIRAIYKASEEKNCTHQLPELITGNQYIFKLTMENEGKPVGNQCYASYPEFNGSGVFMMMGSSKSSSVPKGLIAFESKNVSAFNDVSLHSCFDATSCSWKFKIKINPEQSFQVIEFEQQDVIPGNTTYDFKVFPNSCIGKEDCVNRSKGCNSTECDGMVTHIKGRIRPVSFEYLKVKETIKNGEVVLEWGWPSYGVWDNYFLECTSYPVLDPSCSTPLKIGSKADMGTKDGNLLQVNRLLLDTVYQFAIYSKSYGVPSLKSIPSSYTFMLRKQKSCLISKKIKNGKLVLADESSPDEVSSGQTVYLECNTGFEPSNPFTVFDCVDGDIVSGKAICIADVEFFVIWAITIIASLAVILILVFHEDILDKYLEHMSDERFIGLMKEMMKLAPPSLEQQADEVHAERDGDDKTNTEEPELHILENNEVIPVYRQLSTIIYEAYETFKTPDTDAQEKLQKE